MLINAIKKYPLFFKPSIEPFSQMKKGGERLREESENKNWLPHVNHGAEICSYKKRMSRDKRFKNIEESQGW